MHIHALPGIQPAKSPLHRLRHSLLLLLCALALILGGNVSSAWAKDTNSVHHKSTYATGVGLNVSAQTNFAILICKNATYTNATIIRETPAYVVVSYSGGLAKVAHTNLPDALQKQFNFDPEKAQATLDAEAQHAKDVQRKKVEYANYLATLRGPNQTVRVKSFNSDGTVQIAPGGRVILGNVPAVTINYFQRCNQLQNEINNLQNKTFSATFTSANTFDDSVTSKWAVQDALNDAKRARDRKVSILKEDLAELIQTGADFTTITAFSTGIENARTPVWQCVGLHQE
jgi:hypothetical protein